MPVANRQISFPMVGNPSFRSTADGWGGGGPCVSTNTQAAAARYIQCRNDHHTHLSYPVLAGLYNVSKQGIQRCVKRWEVLAKNGAEDMLRWFQEQQQRAEQLAAAALVSMNMSEDLPPVAPYVQAYKKAGLLVCSGATMASARVTAAMEHGLPKPLSRGTVRKSAATKGLVSPVSAGRPRVLPRSLEATLRTDIAALRASKLVRVWVPFICVA